MIEDNLHVERRKAINFAPCRVMNGTLSTNSFFVLAYFTNCLTAILPVKLAVIFQKSALVEIRGIWQLYSYHTVIISAARDQTIHVIITDYYFSPVTTPRHYSGSGYTNCHTVSCMRYVYLDRSPYCVLIQ